MPIVILPAYKPNEMLISIVSQLQALENNVIVVDDGSGEDYLHIFEEVKDNCILLRHEENMGKGKAIKTALSYIDQERKDVDAIGIMDSDGQHLPKDMQKLLDYAKNHKNALVLGVRSVKDMPFKSRVGNSLTRSIFRLVSGIWVSDTQTGLRAFHLEHVKELLSVSGERYEYEMNVLMDFAKKKIPIEEVVIETIYIDNNASSHFHVVRDSYRIYKNILKFAFASFSSFLLDYFLFTALMALLPFAHTSGYVVAINVLTRIVSASYNYCVNCRFVFETEKKVKTATQYFFLAVVILILNSLILSIFVEKLHVTVYLAKLLTEVFLFAFSWLVQNFMIFRKKK